VCCSPEFNYSLKITNFLNCLGIYGNAWVFLNCLGNSRISSIAYAFPEFPRHFWKCLISANACDIHTRYFCKQCCDNIFRYLIILKHRFLLTNQGKLLTKCNPKYAFLSWSLKPNAQNILYLSSQYCVQKYLVCISP
jgi:hypothetical protein